jgi:enolase
MKIKTVRALEILDSRGKPTVRAFVTLDDNATFSASVPSGASTGTHEAVELRDNDTNLFLGYGVSQAVGNVNSIIAKSLEGQEADPKQVDELMITLDGTENKSTLGANAILAVSEAVVRAAAHAANQPLWKFINDYYFSGRTCLFPRLMVNIVNGGKHAGWNFDIQEFMIVPNSKKPSESVRVAAEIFAGLGMLLKSKKLSTLVGDEGGYSPSLSSNEEVFESIVNAASQTRHTLVKDYTFAVDSAASEFYENGEYVFKKTNEKKTASQLTEYYATIGQKYHIQSFEDPFAEDDWDAFTAFTKMAEQFHFQVVGDDLFVTNPKRIKEGIEKKSANAVLIKPNQIGSILETVRAIQMTQNAGWKTVISHRSGETEDSFIADLAYACAADFIKTGSMSRSERLVKYNRLLEIEAGF